MTPPAMRQAADGGMSESVAEILGVSASAVKMRDMRALARLRALLGEDFPLA